jgi:hypothetical protein
MAVYFGLDVVVPEKFSGAPLIRLARWRAVRAYRKFERNLARRAEEIGSRPGILSCLGAGKHGLLSGLKKLGDRPWRG